MESQLPDIMALQHTNDCIFKAKTLSDRIEYGMRFEVLRTNVRDYGEYLRDPSSYG